MVEEAKTSNRESEINETTLNRIFDDKEYLSRYFAPQMEKGGRAEKTTMLDTELFRAVRTKVTERLEQTTEGKKYLAALQASRPETNFLAVADDLTRRYFHLENTKKMENEDPESSLNRSRRLVSATHESLVKMFLESLPEEQRSSPEVKALADSRAIEKIANIKRAYKLGLVLEASGGSQLEQRVETNLDAEKKKAEGWLNRFMVWLNKRELITQTNNFKKRSESI